jgi:hypothetical protein
MKMKKSAQAREPYERPRVVKVRVVPEEMAVTGCKTMRDETGPTLGCVRTNCRRVGS